MPNHKHNPNLTGNARTLRKNMTKEERHLWYDFLQVRGLTVIRIPNNEINRNFAGVCEYIDHLVRQALQRPHC